MERLLVIQLAKLGDFIQSTALLGKLRLARPEAKICLLAKEPAVLEAARLSPLVDEVFASTDEASAFQSFAAVYVLNSHREAAGAGQSVKCGEHYGPRLIDGELVFAPAQVFLMNLMRLDRKLGRFNLVDVWSSLVPGMEVVSTYWPSESGPKISDISGEAAITAASQPKLQISRHRCGGSLPGLGPGRALIGFQLGSRNHLRRWPVESFVHLGQELISSGLEFTPVLLGTKAETALAKKFKSLWGNAEMIDLVGGTDLRSLTAALNGLNLLVSGDTGVLHLAAALKLPTLGLFFGPAWGPETGPYGSGHLIYQCLAPCGPCRENSACRNRFCLEMPHAEVVAAAAGWLLAGGPSGQVPVPAAIADPPPGHRLWRSTLGLFGQDLLPVDNTVLTPDEALALLLTEAGRRRLNPSYQGDLEGLKSVFQAYRRQAPLKLSRSAIYDNPALAALNGKDEAGIFLTDVRQLATDFGLEFA